MRLCATCWRHRCAGTAGKLSNKQRQAQVLMLQRLDQTCMTFSHSTCPAPYSAHISAALMPLWQFTLHQSFCVDSSPAFAVPQLPPPTNGQSRRQVLHNDCSPLDVCNVVVWYWHHALH